ncbi:methionine ABC transporter ATP-binding protein [Mesobacillus subterraneus]|uniref:Methionine ABC transporter ATP-binding protein n=1 Tax=Mesobacillus subterraneus TaxID=285983 RepID=A0A427TL94_9BACI|nr:methionine ABC transporter ATP-binding protein [Mesobacillus subterraneus]RSD24995.1 methionine ABC transporter ATP-binding protein [Mesobacillus subterraneus]
MIEVRKLVKVYETKKGSVTGVEHVSLTVEKGEIYGIVGYSGAGKSSLIRCLNLLEKPTSGEIIIDGVELTSLNKSELRKARLKIGMIFQHFHLVSAKTVSENIAFALKAAGTPKARINERVNELLEMVGLSDKKDVYPAQLSGGQKQRVGIARALANNPSVLLCDEATSALDPSTTRSILALLKKINRELGITIVLITHEMEVVKTICDRMAVMQDGKIIEEGNVYEIFANPQEPLTRDFVQSILQFELPERLLEERDGKLIKIYFEGEIAEQSVISDVFQNFKVRGNILHGKIEYIQDTPLGIFVMKVTGDPDEIDRAIAYIASRTKNLEVIQYAA